MTTKQAKRAGLVIVLLALAICAGAACRSAQQQPTTTEKFMISISDRHQRQDLEVEGTAIHEGTRLSRAQFLKLAGELEQLTIEYGRRGPGVVTVADEWGTVQVASDTGTVQLRSEVAERIKKLEGVESITVKEPTPVIEQVRAAMTKLRGGEQDDRGGDDFKMAYIPLQPDQARQAQIEGATILDLRPREEFEHEHIAGARSFPLGEAPARLSEIPNTDLTILYFKEVTDPQNPTVRVSPTNEEMNPLFKEFFSRRKYVAVLACELQDWKRSGSPTAAGKE